MAKKPLEFRPRSLAERYEVVERVRDSSLWGKGVECVFRGSTCRITDSSCNAFQFVSCDKFETIGQMESTPLYQMLKNKLGASLKLIMNADNTVGFKAVCTFDAFFHIFLHQCLPVKA